MSLDSVLGLVQTALELGLISSLTVLALFLSYSMLGVCDLSTDGCFTLGATVGAAVAIAGHPYLSIPAAMLCGIGGIVGTSQKNQIVVEQCVNFGNVATTCTLKGTTESGSSATGHAIGGLAGASGGTFIDCYNVGSVKGANQVGGLVGQTFSGTNNGCFVGHISPEAAEGGPIAIVHDGDLVEIDVDSKKLELLVPQEEIEARLKQWKRPEPKFKKGWLGLYCKLAASGSEGGVMKFDHL